MNGGTFDQKWCDLCYIHPIANDEITVPTDTDLNLPDLRERLSGNRYTAFLQSRQLHRNQLRLILDHH